MALQDPLRPQISVVIPVYGEDLVLDELCTRLHNSIAEISQHYEIILVDDRGPGNAWESISRLSSSDSRVKGIRLSRNFGQHVAISAGLDACKGDWCVVMDCDLQDQPEEIPKLFQEAERGFDVVVAKRTNRQDSVLVRFSSKLFYKVFNSFTGRQLNSQIANFGIYSRKVIDSIRQFRERDRSFGLLAMLVGYSRSEVDVSHGARKVGQSSYSFRKRLSLASDLLLSHSDMPLKLAVSLGFCISSISALLGFWLMCRYFLVEQVAEGWTSIMVTVTFLSGLIITVLGVVGLYVGKIYQEVKRRPLYVVESALGIAFPHSSCDY